MVKFFANACEELSVLLCRTQSVLNSHLHVQHVTPRLFSRAEKVIGLFFVF
jgi:hypothetical protein